jgi:Na+-driven multidrug efflux pump
MKDLTQGSVAGHIITMAGPIFISTITFMLWLLVDIYFVAAVGDAAVAGVGAAGSISFLVSSVVLVVSAGTLSLIAQAAGRRPQGQADGRFGAQPVSRHGGDMRCANVALRSRVRAKLHAVGRR